MRCYESAADWQMALPLLLQENPPPAAIRHMAQSLVDNLQAVGRHEDAGTVAATYLMDARVAVQCFVAGGCWRAAFSAVCQARGTARETLRQELLVPGAAAAAAEQLGEIVSDTGRVEKYWARLVQLRERRVAFAAVVSALPQSYLHWSLLFLSMCCLSLHLNVPVLLLSVVRCSLAWMALPLQRFGPRFVYFLSATTVHAGWRVCSPSALWHLCKRRAAWPAVARRFLLS
jgi:hypothetical protein